MSNDRRPIARLTYRKDRVTYSVLSIWPGSYPGTYSINRDKPHGDRQVMSLIDLIKAFAVGDGFVNLSIESQRERRDGGGDQRREESRDYQGYGGGEGPADPEIPFCPRDKRGQV